MHEGKVEELLRKGCMRQYVYERCVCTNVCMYVHMSVSVHVCMCASV